jgi:hypothetical protein
MGQEVRGGHMPEEEVGGVRKGSVGVAVKLQGTDLGVGTHTSCREGQAVIVGTHTSCREGQAVIGVGEERGGGHKSPNGRFIAQK